MRFRLELLLIFVRFDGNSPLPWFTRWMAVFAIMCVISICWTLCHLLRSSLFGVNSEPYSSSIWSLLNWLLLYQPLLSFWNHPQSPFGLHNFISSWLPLLSSSSTANVFVWSLFWLTGMFALAAVFRRQERFLLELFSAELKLHESSSTRCLTRVNLCTVEVTVFALPPLPLPTAIEVEEPAVEDEDQPVIDSMLQPKTVILMPTNASQQSVRTKISFETPDLMDGDKLKCNLPSMRIRYQDGPQLQRRSSIPSSSGGRRSSSPVSEFETQPRKSAIFPELAFELTDRQSRSMFAAWVRRQRAMLTQEVRDQAAAQQLQEKLDSSSSKTRSSASSSDSDPLMPRRRHSFSSVEVPDTAQTARRPSLSGQSPHALLSPTAAAAVASSPKVQPISMASQSLANLLSLGPTEARTSLFSNQSVSTKTAPSVVLNSFSSTRTYSLNW